MDILFVDDDAMNRRVVRDMLQVAGASLAEAPDAETGLRMARDQDFNVILMDLRMPGMDGLTAIRQLRAMDGMRPTLPIVVVTADTAADLRRRCISAGADDVLTKPVAMGPLLTMIGRMIASDPRADGMIH